MPNPINMQQVTLTDGYFFDKENLVREVTLPALYKSYEKTGRVRSFKLNWRGGEPGEPHIFWDSDIAKWIEGAAYTLSVKNDPQLEACIDALVADIAAGQTADGYFNVRYQTVSLSERFTRRSDHELYCAGHLIEAAVAYYRATGKDAMLNIMRKYADYIEEVFLQNPRPEGFQTPGHEEIELALVKLYDATGEERYLHLSQLFVDKRGTLDAEKKHNAGWFGPEYAQDHLPVRAQKTAEGHAVRALYLYAGMADLARITRDADLQAACESLFHNIATQKMYITGGLGGSYHGEAFSYNYDLPNELAYAETCASIAFVFFAQRMFLLTGDVKYIDTMERMLYNAIPAGLSVPGNAFFYTNPLEMHPERREHFQQRMRGQYAPEDERPDDFGCSCCPPNVIRLFSSLRGYMCHADDTRIYVNLYGSSRMEHNGLCIEQMTGYPWDGTVNLTIKAEKPIHKAICLRVPDWCREYTLTEKETSLPLRAENGYITIDRNWSDETNLRFNLNMPVTEIYAHPSVHYNAGRIAVQRGPVVYAAEGADNPGRFIKSAVIKKDASYRTTFHKDLLGGVMVIDCDAAFPQKDRVTDDTALYRSEPYASETGVLRLIPYAVWANRGKNEMSVWLMKERIL